MTAAQLAATRTRAWKRLVDARPPEWVLRHCRAVEALAAAMCDAAEKQGLVPDRAVVQAGALLHDIGRSQVQDVRHASLGEQMLASDGDWPASIRRTVERHTGAGIDAKEAQALGLPVKDYTPKSLEERIVAHADNLYSGDRRLTLDELRAKYLAKGLPAAWARIEDLHRSLGEELGVDLEKLQPAALAEP